MSVRIEHGRLIASATHASASRLTGEIATVAAELGISCIAEPVVAIKVAGDSRDAQRLAAELKKRGIA
jgi:hypothetical protein